MSSCQAKECYRPAFARGWCTGHYQRVRKHGDPGEDVPLRPRGDAPEGRCEVPDCPNPARVRQMCDRHYRRWHIRGKPEDINCLKGPRRQRERKVFKRRDRDGYWLIWGDGCWVRQNRKVMAEILGRPLLPDETVHHKNGIKDDDSPGNLELWASLHPPGQRVADLVSFAREVLERYPH